MQQQMKNKALSREKNLHTGLIQLIFHHQKGERKRQRLVSTFLHHEKYKCIVISRHSIYNGGKFLSKYKLTAMLT